MRGVDQMTPEILPGVLYLWVLGRHSEVLLFVSKLSAQIHEPDSLMSKLYFCQFDIFNNNLIINNLSSLQTTYLFIQQMFTEYFSVPGSILAAF